MRWSNWTNACGLEPTGPFAFADPLIALRHE